MAITPTNQIFLKRIFNLLNKNKNIQADMAITPTNQIFLKRILNLLNKNKNIQADMSFPPTITSFAPSTDQPPLLQAQKKVVI